MSVTKSEKVGANTGVDTLHSYDDPVGYVRSLYYSNAICQIVTSAS